MSELQTDSGKPLRVGLLMDSLIVPAWVHYMLQLLAASDYCSLELLVLGQPMVPSRRSFWQRLSALGPRGRLLADRYLHWDQRRLKQHQNPFTPTDTRELLDNIPSLHVTPKRLRFSDLFEDEDIKSIRAFELDVLIRLGFRVLRGDVLRAARFGVWSLHHGDNLVNRGGPAGFWEVLCDEPTTGATLQILSEDLDGGTVLARTWSASQRGSVAVNRANYFWKTALLIPRALRRLQRLGPERFLAAVRQSNRHPEFYSQRLYTTPCNKELVPLLGGLLTRKIRRRVESFGRSRQWILLYRFGEAPARAPYQFRRLVPPADRFWADPFVWKEGETHYVFFEELEYARSAGRIVVMALASDGTFSKPETVLERPYHLSYPFLLQWQGQLYLIPESSANRTIDVYRCVSFPHNWAHERTLMSGVAAYDSTLVEHRGRWWLFASVREHPSISSAEELFLFHADSPLSANWIPHEANPIVSDVRRARPAGPIFRYNGGLYRPSQDCAERYGYQLRIHEILTLNECEYEEREVTRIEPSWDRDLVGVHHFSFAGQLTMLDAQLNRRALRAPLAQMSHR